DRELLGMVKSGIAQALPALKKLFKANTKATFSFEEILAASREASPSINEDSLRIGLLVGGGLPAGYSCYNTSPEFTEIRLVGVSDNIVDIRNPAEWLEERIQECLRKPLSRRDF